MIARCLATFGLAMTIVGCVLLTKYGLPSDVYPNGMIEVGGGGVLWPPDEVAKFNLYRRCSRLGLWLIIGGTACQGVALWV